MDGKGGNSGHATPKLLFESGAGSLFINPDSGLEVGNWRRFGLVPQTTTKGFGSGNLPLPRVGPPKTKDVSGKTRVSRCAQAFGELQLVGPSGERGVYVGGINAQGLPHGRGNATLGDFVQYEGEWVDGHITGKGRMVWTTGGGLNNSPQNPNTRAGYVGLWERGKANGKGIFSSGNIVADGLWTNGRPNGEVRLIRSKEWMRGSFEDGKKEGQWVVKSQRPHYLKQQWAKGQLISEEPHAPSKDAVESALFCILDRLAPSPLIRAMKTWSAVADMSTRESAEFDFSYFLDLCRSDTRTPLPITSSSTLLQPEQWSGKMNDSHLVMLGEVLKPNTSLTHLDVSSNAFSSSAWSIFTHAIKVNRHLKSLILSSCRMDAIAVMQLLDACRYNPSLYYLDLSHNLIATGHPISFWRKMSRCHNIRFLDLSWCGLGDEGVEAACEAMKFMQLECVGLAGNSITAVGCKALCTLLKENNSVTTLDLWNNCIGDKGVIELCEVLELFNMTLQVVHLGGNEISDGGLVSLGSILLNTKHRGIGSRLHHVNISFNRASDGALSKLVTAARECPNVKLELFNSNSG